MTTSTPSTIAPTQVHETLARDIHADGSLLLPTCGVRSIRFRRPLNLSAAEADTALEIVHKSLKEL